MDIDTPETIKENKVDESKDPVEVSTDKDIENIVDEALKETDIADKEAKEAVEAEVEEALKGSGAEAEVEEALKGSGADTTPDDKNAEETTSDEKKDLLQKIVEDIDLSTDEDDTTLEKYEPPAEQEKKETKSTKTEEEEETLENIQSHIDSIQKSNKFTEEVNSGGVFIALNDNENVTTEDETDKLSADIFGDSKPSEKFKSEIPQVMLDQLNLGKYPNLSISESPGKTNSTKLKPKLKPKSVKLKEQEAKVSIVERTTRQKLNDEIEKMTAAKKKTPAKKAKNESSSEDEGGEDEQAAGRARGRPTKATGKPTPASAKKKDEVEKKKPILKRDANGKFAKKKVEKQSESSLDDDEEEEGEIPRRKLIKMDISKKKTPAKTPAKTPSKVSNASKSKKDTDTAESQTGTEDDEDTDSGALISRSSRRKIKLTDKYKSFVNQEKNINSLLKTLEDESESENEKPVKPKTPKPKTPKPESKTPKPSISDPKITYGTEQVKKTILKTPVVSLKKKILSETETPKTKEKEPEKSPLKSILKNSNKRQTRQSRGVIKRKLVPDQDSDDDIYAVEYDEDKDPDYNSDRASSASESGIEDGEFVDQDLSVEISKSGRTVFEMMEDVFKIMPNWNIHILPLTNSFCFAQIGRNSTGVPVLKKCIEMTSDFHTKVFIQQIHVKRLDGVYDTEDQMIQLIHLVDSM